MRWASLILLAFPALAAAQPERYELGQRLKRFEQAWDAQPDPARRKAALAILPQATQQFFGLQLGEAGRTLDAARHALHAEPPTPAELWMESLYAVPEKRLFDAAVKEFKVTVKHFYPPKGPPPAGLAVTVRVGPKMPTAVPNTFPATVTIPFPDGGWSGDWLLKLDAAAGGDKVETRMQTVSTVVGLAGWLALYNEGFKKNPETGLPAIVANTNIETATLRDRLDLYGELADGMQPETDYPVGTLRWETAWLQGGAVGMTYFAARPGITLPRTDRANGYWLSFPVGKKRVAARLYVPPVVSNGKPVPLVVALHGAGTTENMFFESYGDGYLRKQCEARGWMLLAPRSGLDFGGGPPVPEMIAQLAKRYPVDAKRVYLVGHSMGAAQAVAVAQKTPDLFAGVAALGGGGRVTDAKAFEKLPLFVGVGTADFALAGARALAKSVPTATLKEYPGVEHLVIVREALPDVLAAWK